MGRKHTRRHRVGTGLIVAGVIALLAVSGCGTDSGSTGDDADLVAAVANFDVVTNRPDRFIVGILSADRSRTLAFGGVTLDFAYLGNGEEADQTEGLEFGPVEASFLPIPGQDLTAEATQGPPQMVVGSLMTGVYAAPEVSFEQAGFWQVTVTVDVEGGTETATGAFQVLTSSDLPAVGQPALQTRQPLAGDPGVDPKAIDSRAGKDIPVPDPELHDITVADAIETGRPVMIVVSTPTFCVSRFCGPITDSVQDLASRYGDRMEFIHLEVWQDYAANKVNPAAAEWIAPTPETDGREPWVFVIDHNGIIVQRFDNVASDAELEEAVENVLTTGS